MQGQIKQNCHQKQSLPGPGAMECSLKHTVQNTVLTVVLLRAPGCGLVCLALAGVRTFQKVRSHTRLDPWSVDL